MDNQEVIRLVRAGDELGVAETVREVYDEYGFTWDPEGYHADLYDLSRFSSNSSGRFWVAEDAGVIVGCAGISRFDLVPGSSGSIVSLEGELRVAGTDCDVVRMYVRPSSRGSGIGSKLMTEIVKSAQEWACHGLEIWSDKRFEAAHRLYQRFGAEVVGDRICDDPDESPEWGMWIPLSQ